jgi:hypothetical protein
MQCVFRFLVQRRMAGLSIFGIAGSDPIGDTQAPLPPADRFGLFQSQTHIVYVTGDADTISIDNDGSSMHSMLRWCVFDVCPMGMARGHSPSESNQADRKCLRYWHDPLPSLYRRPSRASSQCRAYSGYTASWAHWYMGSWSFYRSSQRVPDTPIHRWRLRVFRIRRRRHLSVRGQLQNRGHGALRTHIRYSLADPAAGIHVF